MRHGGRLQEVENNYNVARKFAQSNSREWLHIPIEHADDIK